MTHDVFISYSSKDKVVADAIVAALEQHGYRCWYAPRDIKPGAGWGEAITDAIGECKIFIMVFSKNSNQSKRVLEEVFFAISEEKIVIPFRIENLDPTGAMRLHLSMLHWLDAYQPSWRAHLERLIESVSADLDRRVTAPGALEAPTAPLVSLPVKKRNIAPWLWIGLVVVLTILLGTSGFWWLENRPKSEEPQPTALAQTNQPGVVARSPTLAQLSTAIQTSTPPATATRNSSPSATATPIRTPRPSATATIPPSWVTEFTDPVVKLIAGHVPNQASDFTTADIPGWLITRCPDSIEMKITGGELIWETCSMWWSMWYTDFVIEMNIRHLINTDRWHFFYRNQGGYTFYPNRIAMSDGRGAETDQVYVNLENPYQVRIIVQGYETALFINDQPLLYGELPTGFKNGEVNWFQGVNDLVVAFDSIQIWDLNNLK